MITQWTGRRMLFQITNIEIRQSNRSRRLHRVANMRLRPPATGMDVHLRDRDQGAVGARVPLSAARLERRLARKPSNGTDVICGRASVITDIHPANMLPSIRATATERWNSYTNCNDCTVTARQSSRPALPSEPRTVSPGESGRSSSLNFSAPLRPGGRPR